LFYGKVSPHFHNSIGDVMVSVLASNAVYRVFEPLSGQTKNYTVGFYFFAAKRLGLSGKSEYWSPRNQDNVSEWSNTSIHGLLFQIQQSEHHHHIDYNVFSP
jgi:hypothetical protein